MNLFQIGLLFSFPVLTYLLTCETGYWSIFIYVYMTVCKVPRVLFNICENIYYYIINNLYSYLYYYSNFIAHKSQTTVKNPNHQSAKV
jgi:hypothetical protein